MAGSPFKVDWLDKSAVIAYAKKLGPGMIVCKHAGRENFNICMADRPDKWDGHQVIFKT